MNAPLPTTLHFIDGDERPSLSGRTFETRDPATGNLVATVAFGEQEDVDQAVSAAWRAHDDGSWRNASPSTRARTLRKIASLVRERAEQIARTESVDSGKPIADTRNDVEGAATLLEYAATLPENVRGHVYPQQGGYLSYSRREPYGVVGAIAPWNFPFLLAVWKTAPALAVGNSVVLKMAEQAPISSSLYAQICAEAGVPSGVLNVVHGDGSTTGAALARHPQVPKITFTGSTEVGREILRAGAAAIKSCHLELGGKTPNIVLADANLESALEGTLFTSFFNSGQVCTAGSRLIVQEDIADDFVGALVERARALRIGDPLDDTTRLGPLISEEQLARVTGYVRAGIEAGASLATGGKRPALPAPHTNGFFLEPTIFTDVDPLTAIAQEEIFGPVLTVIRFGEDDEAIRIANGVAFGLAATVWTNKLDRALRFAEAIDAGVIWTNWPHGGGWHVPYEGHKHSGIGEDLGLEMAATFTKLKVNHVNISAIPTTW